VERHFRQHHLPGLVRSASELTIDGVMSRRLPDRALGRAIEEAWSSETRSPSKMMQELSARLRQGGLNIFRHRRGMLFVSPIRARVFNHESTGVSASINAILETVTSASGINRKILAEHLAPAGAEPADLERARLTLASDLHWLVSEGYIIEFNDGSLDLPKTKPPVAPGAKGKPSGTSADTPGESAPEVAPVEEQPVAASEEKPATVSEAQSTEPAADIEPVEEKPVETAAATAEEPVAAVSAEPEQSVHRAPEEAPEAVASAETPGA
jgi:hypothetical protein